MVEIIQGDITKIKSEAIINAANTQMRHGGGVALAIARAAGPEFEKRYNKAPEV